MGFEYDDRQYTSLTAIAQEVTGTKWNGFAFFGLTAKEATRRNGSRGVRSPVAPAKTIRCAIYTRKSTEEGLQQEFNSLDAQREAAEAFIASQSGEGWQVVPGSVRRRRLHRRQHGSAGTQAASAGRRGRRMDCVVVYKVDRLSRSLMDFARIIEVFDKHGVSFVSVTQQFNTTKSLGRLTLNILLSFAQFEREIISERTRDKMSAARRKGKWIGGHPVLGYDIDSGGARILINPARSRTGSRNLRLYEKERGLIPVVQELNRRGWHLKRWTSKKGTNAAVSPSLNRPCSDAHQRDLSGQGRIQGHDVSGRA